MTDDLIAFLAFNIGSEHYEYKLNLSYFLDFIMTNCTGQIRLITYSKYTNRLLTELMILYF